MNAIELKSRKSTEDSYRFGFVGYIDILGFSKLMDTKESRVLVSKTYKQIREMLNVNETTFFPHLFGKSHCGDKVYTIVEIGNDNLFTFSDSIFFILIPGQPGGEFLVKYALGACQCMSRILSICWKNSLPARGALSDGDIFYNSSQHVFLGQPIVKAVEWEKCTAFVWFSIEPTSYIANNIISYPEAFLGSNLLNIPLTQRAFFKSKDKNIFLKKYDCLSSKVFTYWPDLKLTNKDCLSKLITKNILSLNGKPLRYWKKTKYLFNTLSFC
jgi:hypothetical protein